VGDTKALRPWLAEGVYNKLAADIRLRKADGITFDPNILEIDENQVMMRFLEDGGPVIVVVYMVQQINCIRKKGEIVEVREVAAMNAFISSWLYLQFTGYSVVIGTKFSDQCIDF
jgi:predicted lipid-binding transport protein (Tim44 family)